MNEHMTTTGKAPVAGFYLPILLLFLLCIISLPSAFSQSSAKINGQVSSADGKALPYASVSLHKPDGQALKGTLSDTLGRFIVSDIPHGKYFLKVSSMGLITHQSAIIELSAQKSSLELPTIVLTEDSKTLSGVTIKAQRRLIEQTIDKTVMNIENSILSEGNTALELLERAPGVTVDQDGAISLKGRAGVLVMINGKQTYLSPKELSTTQSCYYCF